MLDLLIGRHSAPALTDPAPTDAQLATILRAAASVPDHNKLRPYRFVVVRGDARLRFGEALAASAVAAGADDITVAKARRKPLFGPLLVAIVASPVTHNSVPEWEQVATASLTGYAMILAAAALGVGAVWKSGRHLDEAPIVRLLDMDQDERLLGWINLGTLPQREGLPMQPKDETERPEPRLTELPPDPLISVAELAARLGGPDLVICDARWYLGASDRGRTEYATERIPGARFVDLDRDLADHHATGRGRHPLPDPVAFTTRMGGLGIGSATTVIAYDDGSGMPASRLWWMLDALGHRSVRLLDGGIAAWRSAGAPLETGVPAEPTSTDLPLASTWPRTIERDELRDRIGELTLLDVRAGERYRGEVEPVDPKPGHIPGAISAPSAANVGGDGLLRPADALAARFVDLGAADGDVVVSCGSGVTACHTALAMRVAGLPDPILYAGSYSEWVTAGLPVAIGGEPGSLGPGQRSDSRSHDVGIDPEPGRGMALARL